MELRAELEAAIHSYDSGDLARAREQAARWSGAIACLTDPVDPDWLWSAGFVTGLFAWADGDRAAARRAWVAARGLDPQREWDDNFAPRDAVDTFAISVPVDTFSFQAAGGPFLVDGRPAPTHLPVGPHLLQAGEPLRTWLVDVRSPLVAVHPEADPYALPLAELLAVLADRLPAEDVAYVVQGDDLLRFDLHRRSIDVIPAPEPPAPRRKWGRFVVAGGAAAIAAGITTTLLARSSAVQASEDGWTAYEAGDVEGWDDANAAYDSARGFMIGGYAVTGVGVALVGVGTYDLARQSNTRTMTSSAYRLDTRIARSACHPFSDSLTELLSRRSHTTVPSAGSTSMSRTE
jgi:hypothetical protein